MTNLRVKQVRQCFDASDELRVSRKYYRQMVLAFLENLLTIDTGVGDATQNPPKFYNRKCTAIIKAKSPTIVAGLAEIRAFLHHKDLKSESEFQDGDRADAGEIVLTIKGRAGQILNLERIILNVFQRLSGIATVTAEYSQAIAGLPCFVAATRKTLWGAIDKSALQYGGGLTHRLGLSDAAMLKENHLAILKKSGDPQVLLTALKAIAAVEPPLRFVEIEITNDDEFRQVVDAYKNLTMDIYRVIMFDHFTPENIKRLIEATKSEGAYQQILFEASGNITLETIRGYASSGVDVVSVGALTHSVKSADYSLLIVS
ncbi:MAG: carboxylating nicotinate-nucleotide diphosphorylase [Candidatus Neomarinimicrobiota bacterium]